MCCHHQGTALTYIHHDKNKRAEKEGRAGLAWNLPFKQACEVESRREKTFEMGLLDLTLPGHAHARVTCNHVAQIVSSHRPYPSRKNLPRVSANQTFFSCGVHTRLHAAPALHTHFTRRKTGHILGVRVNIQQRRFPR